MSREAVLHDDGRYRCPWPGRDPLYVAYHDTEWGVPEYDSRALFEKLILDGFQAGLSWITILRKRENFRQAFDQFDPQAIARYDAARVETLMLDAGIIRNRAKIAGTVKSAQMWLDMEERGESFSELIWSFVGGQPVQSNLRSMADAPTQSDASMAMSKELKRRGFTFCGPTITYAFMQATGLVNDHLVDCFRHAECAAMAK
ncbi:DNA-3-methyladenine glycosylase [Agaricicola taiwanensis]|uniref:DNA-3-methyladenine glycosylase I n=1 Tax=Agaricicola taiwanensis TaxID=591372 RepID=A0A8J2VL74_9RHOB|nr:DNA-3-methyladenine glycosylase I [Agaricicola taiwanensis]GGE35670.1 DNA-3-methyladenine glycosylase [Agaricicola taiwanensis]